MRQESFEEFYASSAEVAASVSAGARIPSIDARPADPLKVGPPPSSARPSGTGGSRTTPMLEQFRAAKRDAPPDALLFFRMGDFFELFGDDAVIAARELGIALTSRDKGEDALPMAGVPARAVDSYLLRLVRKGFTVAICDQLSDPKASKGLVERGIVRIVTPGTLTEEDALDARAHNYLASVYVGRSGASLAWLDASTGLFHALEAAPEKLDEELVRLAPAEILCSASWRAEHERIAAQIGARLSERDEWRFERETARRALLQQLGVLTLSGYGIGDDSPIVPAAGVLVEYLRETQRSACAHVRELKLVQPSEYLVLDRPTRACLELVANQRGGDTQRERTRGTLLEALDRTRTPMGGRLLRDWLLAPLRRLAPIQERQDAVAELLDARRTRERVREELGSVLDIERLAAKVSTGRASPRDLVALAGSLARVPALKQQLADARGARLCSLRDALDPLAELSRRMLGMLVDAPPLAVKEGGLVRDGVHTELDELRVLQRDGKSCMARFQADEIARSGIPGLKIGYHTVFGYYLEVPRGQLERVPATYIRKQTVKHAERYVTPELKEFETKVLRAEERAFELEYELFLELRLAAAAEVARILATAAAVAELDVLVSLAEKAVDARWCRPEVHSGDAIEIREGRHPVLESATEIGAFVPNGAELDAHAHNLTILTGPNMAGKSTYIRQIAEIVLLAQLGSFVPAASARIGLVDRIFTRVGSGDDISRGESTFMVEMVELALILNNATDRSLVILDEVGRGTSTFDGLALAWAIAEHISQTIHARTIFATHYHQLTELASRYPGICNKSVAVREWGDEIVFLHRIVEGGTDRSYGIHVARLAGVPKELVARAKEILRDIEEDAAGLAPRLADGASVAADRATPVAAQAELYPPRLAAIEQRLHELDVDRMSPIEALLALRELKDRLG
jgi:DNA mismatch repair protein MutS